MATAEEVAGQELRRLRIGLGWSQEEVAERMKNYGYEWHQTLVGRIEAANRPLRLNEAVDLAALFDVPLERLLRAAPEIDADTLRVRIAEARQRLEVAEQRYAELHALWDEGTAQLARLGPRHTYAQQVLARERADLDMLLSLEGQSARAETRKSEESPT